MTPNKQVSPAIRILRGERDASARATHLEAVTRKFLVTTNERKQMSTTTNFKRIALVAVAALGMGLLSSAPSQAAFSGAAGSQLTVTVANGTGSLSKSDTTTAGTVSVTGLALASTDSYTVQAVSKSKPAAAAAAPRLIFVIVDTLTSTTNTTISGVSLNAAASPVAFTPSLNQAAADSATAITVTAGSGSGYVNTSYKVFMESVTTRAAGDYVYTIIATPSALGVNETPITKDITFTIATPAIDSEVASPAFSTLFIGGSGAGADVAQSHLATASDTAKAYLNVSLRNISNGSAAKESVTITTTIGTVGDGSSVRGRSVVLKYTGTTQAYPIYSDGTAGVATITVSTPSVTFSTKSVNFYAAAAKTITATVATPLLAVGENAKAVRGVAVDANGNAWTGTAYIVASSAADALIAGSTTPVQCLPYNATDARHECPITAVAAGTAKFKIIDASTVALATATSNEVTVTVSTATMASVKIEFDKATYAPNERAMIYITPLDSTGKAMQQATYTNVLASGISVNGALSYVGSTTTADSLTAVTGFKTADQNSSSSRARAGSQQFTVFMPSSGGTVTLTATGGTALPLALRTTGGITASATVTDSGAAALAAVNALATTVASLRTLITTLTNLVLKIQKKVKA